MEISVMLTGHRVTLSQAIEYHEKRLKLQCKSVMGPEKEDPMEISVMVSGLWVTSEKALSIMKNT